MMKLNVDYDCFKILQVVFLRNFEKCLKISSNCYRCGFKMLLNPEKYFCILILDIYAWSQMRRDSILLSQFKWHMYMLWLFLILPFRLLNNYS